MSSGNELTPQQEFDKLLRSAAVDIARMEQIRDSPGRPDNPAPTPKFPGAPTNTDGRPPVNKDYQNNLIANKKAETLKKVSEISNRVPADSKKQMQDKAYATLYPQDKKDLNQIPKNQNFRDEKGNHLGDKTVDNAQEKANALRGKQATKNLEKNSGSEVDKSQDRAEALKTKSGNKDNPEAQKKDSKGQYNKTSKEQSANSMSKQFKQSLEGNNIKAKDVQNPKQDKSSSMSVKFSQPMSNTKSLSHTIKSSPSPPSGRE